MGRILTEAWIAVVRSARVVAAGGTLLAALVGDAGAQQRATLERIIQRLVLPNGLEVIAIENHGVPLATAEIVVRNGAFTQPKGFEGLAHLYEHMFFQSNVSYPDQARFAARATELGAVYNATTDEEKVSYYLTMPADSLEGGMRFLAAALRTPLFRRDELERERQVVIGEYDRAESNPFWRLTTAMGKVLWGDQWSRKNALGERASILATTPDQMRAIQRRYYVPNNSALIISGDVVSDSVFAWAVRHYGDWPRAADPFADAPVPPIPPLPRDSAVIVEEQVGAVTVLLQWQGPSVGSDPEATYAADVFSDALNQPGSALQRRLVDSGLWDAVGVNYYTLNHVGPITISGQTASDRLRDALIALERELNRFGEPGYFSPAELAPVKQQRRVGTAFGIERASGFAHTIGFWWSVASLDYFMGYVDAMARQTPEQLRAYARRYIVGKPKVTGILISPASRASLALDPSNLPTVSRGAR